MAYGNRIRELNMGLDYDDELQLSIVSAFERWSRPGTPILPSLRILRGLHAQEAMLKFIPILPPTVHTLKLLQLGGIPDTIAKQSRWHAEVEPFLRQIHQAAHVIHPHTTGPPDPIHFHPACTLTPAKCREERGNRFPHLHFDCQSKTRILWILSLLHHAKQLFHHN